MNKILVVAAILLGSFGFTACSSSDQNKPKETVANTVDTTNKTIAVSSEPRQEVPILCYHNIKKELGKHSPDLTTTIELFNAQVKMLSDSGYHTILPDDYYNYLTKGGKLPSKPIMLTFDDSREEHFSIAAQEMKKYGFKGAFFIMTVAINKPNYITREQIKTLSDEGNTIACHTYDHQFATKIKGDEWIKQLDKPKQILEQITGKPINYFAYPFGEWNDSAIIELKRHGITAAFQLSKPLSNNEPLYTLRRTLVPGNWSLNRLDRTIKTIFNHKILIKPEDK